MTKKEKWIVDEDDELRLFYGDENFNGSAYPCNDIVFMEMIADKLNKLEEENEQSKQFQDRVFSWIDMHLQRLRTLINEEFDSDNEFADSSLYSGALQILETMKKELKSDME